MLRHPLTAGLRSSLPVDPAYTPTAQNTDRAVSPPSRCNNPILVSADRLAFPYVRVYNISRAAFCRDIIQGATDMREYLIFIAMCTAIGLLPRLLPARWKPRVLRPLNGLFWTVSVPATIAFLGFVLISYVAAIGNLSSKSTFFLTLITAFVSYYGGAVASSAGKLVLGPRYCHMHENTRLVCPECQRGGTQDQLR